MGYQRLPYDLLWMVVELPLMVVNGAFKGRSVVVKQAEFDSKDKTE
jgi:hypothetical protein